jgi:hypothetical protein
VSVVGTMGIPVSAPGVGPSSPLKNSQATIEIKNRAYEIHGSNQRGAGVKHWLRRT